MLKGRHIDIMGIINLTDDSFYAASRCVELGSVIKRVQQMLDEGATIIDFGACSSRPGSEPVGPEEEWSRLEPVLMEVKEMWPDLEVSIDTSWSYVVSKAYDILGQSKNLSVSDSADYHLETRNNTLGRYIILSVTYRFGNFNASGNGRGRGGHGRHGGRGRR